MTRKKINNFFLLTGFALLVVPGTVLAHQAVLHESAPLLNAAQVMRLYVKFGFEHILPKGLDHILFVLGLFLLSTKFKPLCWQISMFTLAHTITLALSTNGVINLSPHIVEPLIALSIAFIAIENIFTSQLHAWRPAVVFIFGLLHGLGFAGALAELPMPARQFMTALISFNAGVELGQLTVIALAFSVLGAFRSRSWYRSYIVIPASALIACTGLFWTYQRIFLV